MAQNRQHLVQLQQTNNLKTKNKADILIDREAARRRQHRDNLNDFEDNKCARCITKLICRIPCLIVCGIIGGDTWLLFGYSRLALIEEVGTIITSLLLSIYTVCISLLLTSYFRCMLTSSAVEDNPPPPDFDSDRCPTCNKCGQWKPPRAHHCSLCGTCTLKMDHHWCVCIHRIFVCVFTDFLYTVHGSETVLDSGITNFF